MAIDPKKQTDRIPIRGSNILVTGGAGFIGSHLVDELYISGAKKVIIVDNLFNGYESNLADSFALGSVLIKDDAEFYSSLDYIFAKENINIVFNCATKALNYSFVNPENAYMTNVNVIRNLLEFQRKGAYKTLCHFSTSEVYGSAVYEPMDEKHPILPTTTYAAGKAAADIMLESYVRMFGLDSFIVRPFNNFGPRQNYQGYLAGVIPITVKRIYDKQKPEIHGDGTQTRDFVFALDTVKVIVQLYDLMPKGESINIASKGQIKISEVINKIIEITGYKGEILFKESRGSDVMTHNASTEKLSRYSSHQYVSFEEALAITVEWYLKLFKNNDKIN